MDSIAASLHSASGRAATTAGALPRRRVILAACRRFGLCATTQASPTPQKRPVADIVSRPASRARAA